MTIVTGKSVRLTVRYFAAAQAAVGSASEQLTVPRGTTVDELAERLSDSNAELARVLLRCSFLRDGVAVRDRSRPLESDTTIDVLPPFAGG